MATALSIATAARHAAQEAATRRRAAEAKNRAAAKDRHRAADFARLITAMPASVLTSNYQPSSYLPPQATLFSDAAAAAEDGNYSGLIPITPSQAAGGTHAEHVQHVAAIAQRKALGLKTPGADADAKKATLKKYGLYAAGGVLLILAWKYRKKLA